MRIYYEVFSISQTLTIELSIFRGSPEDVMVYSYRLTATTRQGRHTDKREGLVGGNSSSLEETMDSAFTQIKQKVLDAYTEIE